MGWVDIDKRGPDRNFCGPPEKTTERQKGYPVIYDSKKVRFFAALVRRRDNDFYRRGLARRYALQFQEEDIDAYEWVAATEQKSYQRQLRSAKLRYKAFPLNNGTAVIVSAKGNKFLPVDQEDLVKLIDGWIASIPEGKSTSGTRKFGGRFAGAEARRKEPGRFLRLKCSTQEVIATLEKDRLLYLGSSDRGVTLMMEPGEALRYVREHFTLVRG